jgi:ABC-type dipeptide/oligopeptide/nickel transport system permease subunit
MVRATLSFLGVGVPPPAIVGRHDHRARRLLPDRPSRRCPPGLAIMATILAFNLWATHWPMPWTSSLALMRVVGALPTG